MSNSRINFILWLPAIWIIVSTTSCHKKSSPNITKSSQMNHYHQNDELKNNPSTTPDDMIQIVPVYELRDTANIPVRVDTEIKGK